MITPTVGRVVWFYRDGVQHAAIIAKVWNDRMVNLAVFDEAGRASNQTSVPLVQEGDTIPSGSYYAVWMPFQIGQAKKES